MPLEMDVLGSKYQAHAAGAKKLDDAIVSEPADTGCSRGRRQKSERVRATSGRNPGLAAEGLGFTRCGRGRERFRRFFTLFHGATAPPQSAADFAAVLRLQCVAILGFGKRLQFTIAAEPERPA